MSAVLDTIYLLVINYLNESTLLSARKQTTEVDSDLDMPDDERDENLTLNFCT